MNTDITCHHCKKALIVQHPDSLVAVCSTCGTINRRNPIPADYLIAFELAKEDYSPIQIGTEGYYDKERFEVTGRFRYDFRDACRNQWSLILESGQRMWLVESFGYYSIVKREDLKIPASEYRNTKASDIISFDDKEWTIETMYKNYAYQGEGEMHEWIPVPVSHVQLEMSTDTGEVIFTNLLARSEFVFYRGKYFEFDQLKFKNFRTSQVWS